MRAERPTATAPLDGGDAAERPRVLVVDDDVPLLDSLRLALGRRGFEVMTAEDSGEAVQYVQERNPPDLVVLDVMMPGMNGITLAKLLRTQTAAPILMLSARDAVADKVEGLSAGADDYLPKPFDLDELVARLLALRRRSRETAPRVSGAKEYGGLSLDTGSWTATRDGSALALTRTEFRLLELLLLTPQVVCRREDIVRGIWGLGALESDSNSLEVHIANLRQKLEHGGKPRLVHTVRGVGYVIRV